MKKTLILAVIAAAVVTTSCRKDRTCTCTSTITDTNTGGGQTVTVAGTGSSTETWKSVKKGQAQLSNCYNRTETTTDISGTGANQSTDVIVTVYSCTLK